MASAAHHEHLSSLLDNELDPATLNATLDAVCGDESLRALWGRYHLASEVLRGEVINGDMMTVADRVRQRLATEATVLPLTPVRPSLAFNRLHAGRWALAASVALLAVFSGSTLFQGDVDPYDPAVLVETLSPPALYSDTSEAGHWGGLHRPEVESKLNSFLVNHQEHSPMAGLKGMVPYATFVHYDSPR